MRLPDAKGLAAYTRQVYANTPQASRAPPFLAGEGARPRATLRHINHVIYIIRENRTYDQVFGDIKAGNGDPDLTIFGATVTPNAHALAARSVLLDNLYCNGEVSEDGHQWCDAAYATDFTEKRLAQQLQRPGRTRRRRAADRLAGGLSLGQLRPARLTYHTYGEFSSFTSSPNSPPVFTGAKSLSGHASAAWNAISFDRHDTERAALFLADLHAAEKTGQWPRFVVMSLGEEPHAGAGARQIHARRPCRRQRSGAGADRGRRQPFALLERHGDFRH